ncbi:MAG: flagellar hook-associated protein FlgK [Dehalococcoidia bacterium]|nr:flagellar hook-associated protein FlgK [Dehalococcoidia bacterium]
MALSIGLDTAVKALRAHQLAVDVASHNIANAQTPGFSRQRVILRPVGITASGWSSHDSLLGRAGNGVDASDVNRVRDMFFDFQARQTIGSKAQYESFSEALGRAELTFSEPSDAGMGNLLGAFYDAWHDVVNDPESPAARVALVHATTTLTANIRRAYNDLDKIRKDVNTSVNAIQDEINSRTQEIAQLNQQIVQVEASGEMANDLRDRRDLLVDQLSAIANVTYSENPNHSLNIYLGSHELVAASKWDKVAAVNDPSNPGMQKLVFTDDGLDVNATNGKLRGLLDARDTAIPGLITKLNQFATQLITQVNTIHSAGYGLDGSTGNDFLTGTGAADIDINAAISASPETIAASSTPGTVGNSQTALAIADLQHTASAALGNNTFDEFYGNMVSVLGADVARAKGMADSASLMNQHIESQRQGVQGVNIDEEVTNMNAAQHAYQAAARVVTTIDQMLDTLINNTGVVGR